MHLHTRNVNTAFKTLVAGFRGKPPYDTDGMKPFSDKCWANVVRRNSRNGPVLVIDEPVTITYSHPTERVLFNQARDANPFMHLYESLWMLAGRNDVAPLAYYAKNFLNYSDDGKTLNGAYGYRWRHAERYEWSNPTDLYRSENVDQLKILIDHLKADPTSRRAVLQMWNVEDDLLKIGLKEITTEANKQYRTFSPPSRDVCCNLSVMFSLREIVTNNVGKMSAAALESGAREEVTNCVLDMTVTNRSNDLVWGCLGSDYCLSGDNVLSSPEGARSLAELSGQFASGKLKRWPVYSFDTSTKNVKASWCTKVWKVGSKKVLKIGFDDGTFVKATKDHKFFKRVWNDKDTCTEVEAGDLSVGNRVWAGRVWRSPNGRGAIVKRLGVSSGQGNLSMTARLYWELLNGRSIPNGYDVHHKDENPGNDTSSNLELLKDEDHHRHHASTREITDSMRLNMSTSRKAYFARMTTEEREKYAEDRRGYEHSDETKQRMSQGQQEYWAGVSEEERKEHGRKIAATMKSRPPSKRFAGRKHSAETLAKMAEARRAYWAAKKANHKVTSIEECGTEDVYDFTVPGDHNGMLANGVFVHNCHFSVLQEYMAAHLGVEVGVYHHFSNNLHVYENNWKPEEWLADPTPDFYQSGGRVLLPLVKDAAAFDAEVHSVVNIFDGIRQDSLGRCWNPTEPFLRNVAWPMFSTHYAYKRGDYRNAADFTRQIEADDWRIATTQWLERRISKKGVKV